MQRRLSYLEEAETSQAAWKKFRQTEAPDKGILQPVELLRVCRVLRVLRSVRCHPRWAACGAAAVFELLLLQSVTPGKPSGSLRWTLLVFVLWSVLDSLSGVSRCVCCIFPGKVLSHNKVSSFVDHSSLCFAYV